jgi:hypothetical protein
MKITTRKTDPKMCRCFIEQSYNMRRGWSVSIVRPEVRKTYLEEMNPPVRVLNIMKACGIFRADQTNEVSFSDVKLKCYTSQDIVQCWKVYKQMRIIANG